MKSPLVAFALVVLAGTAAQAQARSPFGGATMPREPVQSDTLGPRSNPTTTVAAAIARTQIEKVGYTQVRGVQPAGDGSFRAVARDKSNAPVAVVVDSQGRVTTAR